MRRKRLEGSSPQRFRAVLFELEGPKYGQYCENTRYCAGISSEKPRTSCHTGLSCTGTFQELHNTSPHGEVMQQGWRSAEESSSRKSQSSKQPKICRQKIQVGGHSNRSSVARPKRQDSGVARIRKYLREGSSWFEWREKIRPWLLRPTLGAAMHITDNLGS